jgi:hypothetical protein
MLGKEKKGDLFLFLVSASCVAVILCAFYFLYYKQGYDFIVEVSCNPTQEECFQRDCSNPDDCPANGLSDFKRYSVQAADFKMCRNEDCTTACADGTIQCQPVVCVEDLEAGESCSLPVSPTNDE